MSSSETINEIAKALSLAQANMENATLNKVNPHFKSKYADLASILESIRKPLADNGLSIVQLVQHNEAGWTLQTVLMHTSGQWIKSNYPLPANATPQQMGSALTYARRYSLSSMMCNAADEDDDANAAETAPRAPKAAPVSIAKPEQSAHSKPVKLEPPIDPAGWIEFGKLVIAGVKFTGKPGEWVAKNAEAFDRMRDEAPKVYDRVMANIQPVTEAAE